MLQFALTAEKYLQADARTNGRTSTLLIVKVQKIHRGKSNFTHVETVDLKQPYCMIWKADKNHVRDIKRLHAATMQFIAFMETRR